MTTATKYKTYPKYKPSGIDWLGDIPAGWEVKKAKFLSDFVSGYSFDSESYTDDGVPIIRIGDISEIIDFENVKKVPVELSIGLEKFNIKNGDILLALTGATIGKTAIYNSTEFALLNQRVAILRGKKLDQKYLTYFIASSIFKENIDYLCFGGAQENIGKSEIGSIIISYPKIDEQKEIVAFLDLETTKIDEVIGKKQKLMELLKEKRQALITHTVTKGLDPKAKMKPSGIDWLGDIPEGWESWKVSHLFNKIGSGTTPPSENMDYYEGAIPWVITGELKDNEIFDSETKVTKKAVQELSALKIFPKDSLLIAMYGATIGKMAILRIPATTNQASCVLGDSKLIDIDFAFYYFLSFRPHLIALSYGGGQPNISQDTIKSIKIFLPVLAEQKEIVAFLDGETAKIDGIIKKVETQIEKLQEYRQALITSAVTGKIMVN